MKERPILFSAPMVRAILAGTKTQTRRVVKPQPYGVALVASGNHIFDYRDDLGDYSRVVPMKKAVTLCPYGQPGDRLWVRETWYCDDYRVQRGPYLKPDDMDVAEARGDGTLVYRASSGDRPYEAEQPVWRPAIHMPRWASRITLEVTGVRVERLQEISEADTVAEGVVELPMAALPPKSLWSAHAAAGCELHAKSAAGAYAKLWDSINGPGSWDLNPWVWVVEFKKVGGAT